MIYMILQKMRSAFQRLVVNPLIKSSFGSCGKKVYVSKGCVFAGIGNIYIGNDVSIGPNATMYCTKAPIRIKDHVIFVVLLINFIIFKKKLHNLVRSVLTKAR